MAKVTVKQYSVEDLLSIYNSISPSRARWIRNRNDLRNKWSELFVALEKMSGRNGLTATVFDPNWHKLTEKGVRNKEQHVNIGVAESGWSDKDLTA